MDPRSRTGKPAHLYRLTTSRRLVCGLGLWLLLAACQASLSTNQLPARTDSVGEPPSVTSLPDDVTKPAGPVATVGQSEPPKTQAAAKPARATSTRRPTATPAATATATPIGPCAERVAQNDLLTLVTQTHGLSRHFEPHDLEPLSDYLPLQVTLGYPTQLRRPVIAPLLQLIETMQAEGLQPLILSGYRSYAAQNMAWNKWLRLEPERAAILSAPPGHSEHQLGTTIDFGSHELPAIVGQANIEFHTYFYKTSEGAWLLENAHNFGFTLSYPLEAFEVTGFYYEPWHYRYVGVDLATRLFDLNTSLTEYLLAKHGEPCLP